MASSHRNSIKHSSLGKERSIDRDNNPRVSCLWIWNSGEVRDMLREDTDDELDWDNFREISGASASAVRGEDDLAFFDDSFVEESSLNDTTEREYEIEDIPNDTTRINHQMSPLDDRSVGRSVDTMQSVDTLSYDDDVVATFNDDAVAEEISRAVSDALARAYQTFDSRQKASSSAECETEKEARRIVVEDSCINHITAHTAASMTLSEFYSSDMESFHEFDDQESEESDMVSEKIATVRAQEEDLHSIVSSDFHSSDLESIDAKEDDRVDETDGLKESGIPESPQDEDSNNSFSIEDIHDVTKEKRDAGGTYYFETSEDYVPVGGRDLHSTNSELTGSIVSSASDSDGMYLNDDSDSDCNEYTVELRRPPLHHSISGLTCFSAALQPEVSSRSLHSPASKRARSPIDHPSPKTWMKVVAQARLDLIPPKPPTRIQSLPAPSALPQAYQKPSAKPSPIPSTKQFLDTHLPPRWSKVAASSPKKIERKQSKKRGKKKKIPKARPTSNDLDMDTVPAAPVLSPSITKRSTSAAVPASPVLSPSITKRSTSAAVPAAPVLSPSTTKKSTSAGKPIALAQEKDVSFSPSSAKKEKNRANLEQLNSKMNSAIGVQMSPSSLAKSTKMPLSKRRERLKTLRERLRENFRHAVSPTRESS
jgi:hypothetical protein